MSGLFGSLGMAARSMDAQRLGLDTAGQNVANVNTPGYARRTVDYASVPAYTILEAGGGVETKGVRAIRDQFLTQRVQQEVPLAGRHAALAEALEVVEAALGPAGASIDDALNEFFGAFSRLADAPTSAVARDDVINQSQSLVRAFQEVGTRLRDERRATDTRVKATAAEINAIAAQLGAVNQAYGSVGPGPASLHLKDQQAALVRQLSELVPVDVHERATGGVDITFGNGRALIVGEEIFSIEAQPTPPEGLATLMVGGRDVTAEVTGGRLGGLIAARDTAIPDYITRLDTLAFAVADEVNTVHAAGFDLLGNTGTDLFSFTAPPVGVAGAARALQVNPAVAADPRLIAAGSVAQAGDNVVARDLANLRDARVLDGGSATLSDSWSQLVYRVGRDVRTARDERDSRGEIVRQVEALRDQVEGVSLDEEAAHLIKFQRAYEANAKFFSVVDQTLAVLMDLVR